MMNKARLEAFGDAVLAIVITIMVLELHAPEAASLEALLALAPRFLSYLLSFIFLAIYWNNHHHLFQAVEGVSGAVMWAKLHLLFWLSLVPFATSWLGGTGALALPVAAYGTVLLLAALAYYVLVRALIRLHGPESELARAIGEDWKGKLSVVIYAVAIAVSFYVPWLALALYVSVAAIWLVPDRRFEPAL